MIGTVVGGRYSLTKEAESDGVFLGFKGVDQTTNRDIFARMIRPEAEGDGGIVSTLTDIVANLKGVRHNGIEKVIGVFEEGEHFYLVSEAFEGISIESRLRKLANLSVPVAVGMAIEIAEALEIVHEADIVHGDISPRTVFSQANDKAKLVTVGFWKAYAYSNTAARVKAREMGPYLAPEVTAGSMPSVGSDIYAVGVLLWQMLAGRPPYSAESVSSLAAKHSSQEYPSVRSVVPAVPVALDKVIEKAMSKNPLHRYGSVRSLLDDLKIIQDGLRFGRPLAWPLRPDSGEEVQVKIAPELNVVDSELVEEEEVAKKKKRRRDAEVSDSLPMWLSGLVYLSLTMMIIVVGVWIFFNIQKPKSQLMPDLIGKPVEEARKELEKMDVKLRIARLESSNEHPKDVIISLAPAPGENVKEHSYVEAVVSSGSRIVELPDFRGRSLDEVTQIIEGLSLKLEKADIEYVRDRELEKGMIVSQSPEPRTKVERLSSIKLKVSNGNERVSTDSASDRRTERDLVFTIPRSIEGTVSVRVEAEDARAKREIYSATHSGGDEIVEKFSAYGDSVQILIYFDDKLVTTQNKKISEGD